MNVAERRANGLYWDRAWKLVEGCSKVSAGCDNCWSEAETAMRAMHTNHKIRDRARRVTSYKAESVDPLIFDGRIVCREDNLDLPLRIKKPTVFATWNDLWHENVPMSFICDAVQVMERARKLGHIFLVLTKRAERMGTFLGEVGEAVPDHIWHGVTVENQEQADLRIPHLLNIPGKRFVSVEPMLGPIDVKIHCVKCGHLSDAECPGSDGPCRLRPEIHAVLLGGESGKSARPMHSEWARAVRDQCETSRIPFFFKQWGEWIPGKEAFKHGIIPSNEHHPFGLCQPSMARVGKKRAGRLLDGNLYNALPWDKEAP